MSKPGDVWRSKCGAMELRCGKWQDVLSDIETCDAVITDPPYSEKTHAGYRTGGKTEGSISRQTGIQKYQSIKPKNARALVGWAWRIVSRWVVLWGDDKTQAWFNSYLRRSGAYVFAPIPWLKTNAPPRFTGDGPQSAVEWITVARTKKARDSGSLPGWYMVGRAGEKKNGSLVTGQKNLAGVRAVVGDYSRAGDLILDPYAGSGTTLLAAAIEGRRAIGAEMDPKTFDLAVKRLKRGYTPSMF